MVFADEGDTEASTTRFSSGRREVRLTGPSALRSRWTEIAAFVPGHAPSRDTPPDLTVRLPPDISIGDARRVVNAHLHVMHIEYRTLCVHGVALAHPRDVGGVLLLGGHRAGKSLVGLELVARGWRTLSGDVALIDMSDSGGPVVAGGTAAYVIRRASVIRWFPDLMADVTGADGDKVDARSWLPRLQETRAKEPTPLRASFMVHVDGDPGAASAPLTAPDAHTSVSTLYRASQHLLDRVTEDPALLPRGLETAGLLQTRLALVRDLAAAAPMRAAWGPPAVIADHIEAMSVPGTPTPH